ncbi:hypothetical protein H0H87_011666 [Tephrocybe sp. NHM501043]|nr:hypothetical protein H0H87_011666 [Tephrocybe sp. NHM501043]
MSSPFLDNLPDLAALRIEFEDKNAQFRSENADLFAPKELRTKDLEVYEPRRDKDIKIFKNISCVPDITLNFAQSQSNIIPPIFLDCDTSNVECVSPRALSEFSLPFSDDSTTSLSHGYISPGRAGPASDFVPSPSPLSLSFSPSPSVMRLHGDASPISVPSNLGPSTPSDILGTPWLRLSPVDPHSAPVASSSRSPVREANRINKVNRMNKKEVTSDKSTKKPQHACPFTMCCNDSLARLNDLYRHVAVIHLPPRPLYECHKCGSHFSRHDSRDRHLVGNSCGKWNHSEKQQVPPDVLEAIERLRNSNHPVIEAGWKYLKNLNER